MIERRSGARRGATRHGRSRRHLVVRARMLETFIVVGGEMMTMGAVFVVPFEGVTGSGDFGDKENLARTAIANASGWMEDQKRRNHAAVSRTATARLHRAGAKGRRVV